MALTGLRPSRRKDRSKKSKHKVEKKLEKKLQFHAKVRDVAVTLGATKAIDKSKRKRLRSWQKKLKAYDLSPLAEFLPDLSASQHQPETTIT